MSTIYLSKRPADSEQQTIVAHSLRNAALTTRVANSQIILCVTSPDFSDRVQEIENSWTLDVTMS